MLEKIDSYTKLEITEQGKVSLRKTTRVVEDGIVLSENHHREMRYPVDDISDLPQHIQDTINAYWTEEVREAWNDLVIKANEELT
jgi:vacuolar-type H+-ATPase catalytic subunit A/Vma1